MNQTRTFGPTAIATPANALTAIRLLLTPLVVALILSQHRSWWLVAVWLFMAGTDWVDGRVARRHGATVSGAFLDPLADKFLVLGAFAALIAIGTLPLIPIVVIAAREVAMSIYRSVVGTRGKSVPATRLAKAKAWVQDAVVALAVAPIMAGGIGGAFTVAMLWVATVITVVTGVQYALAARR